MKGVRFSACFSLTAAAGLALGAPSALAQNVSAGPRGLRRDRRSPDDRRLRDDAAGRNRRRHRPGSGRRHHHQLATDRASAIAEHRQVARAADAERRRAGRRGQSVSARRLFSRLRRLAGLRHAAGARRLSEWRAHQRGLRRFRQLGPDPDLGGALDRRHQQQSRPSGSTRSAAR